MLVAAALIGVLTAYYFGIKIGGIAAGVSLFLFLIATTVPGAALPVYALVGLGILAVVFVGPRMPRPEGSNNLLAWSRRTLGKLLRRM